MGRKKQQPDVDARVEVCEPLNDELYVERWDRAWLLLDELDRRLEDQRVVVEREVVEA